MTPTERLGGKALLVSGPIMLSRVLAVVREQMVAALLGSTPAAQAFTLAYRIPNLARDLFAEGALAAAFVPTFTDVDRRQGPQAAFRLANAVIGLVLVVVGSLAVFGIAFAGPIVSLFPYDRPEVGTLAVPALRILFPFLPIISLAAVAMGQLNAREHFVVPALAPALFNVVSIVAGGVLLVADSPTETTFIAWSWTMVAGGATQLAVQIPSLWRLGFRFRPRLDLDDPGVRRILHLMAPAVLGVAAMNVNVIVNTVFAVQEDGAIVWLEKASRLIYLPIGVFGVAIGILATTRVAQRAADRDLPGLRATLDDGLRLVVYLTVPSALGLIALRTPIVQLLYENGRFTAADTSSTAAALLMYAFGLCPWAAVKVVAPAFYALNHARAPLVASACAVLVNVGLNIVLFPLMGFQGLALGTAASACVNIGVLLIAFRRVAGGLPVHSLAVHTLRVGVAAAASAAAALALHATLASSLGTAGVVPRAAAVGAAVVLGGVVYVAAARLLGATEFGQLLAVFHRKLPSGDGSDGGE